MSQPDISVIVPLYNESEVFDALVSRLDALDKQLSFELEFVLVDDGSQDSTTERIEQLCYKNTRYSGVLLSRNFGHQIAVSAGMQSVRAKEAVMIIDGDLQDPPELVIDFYNKLQEGYDVVYAVREKRKEHAIKKGAYWLFYRLLNSISNVDIPLDSGDCCMVTRRVNDLICEMPEQSRFVRGLRRWVGFEQCGLVCERARRESGKPKYDMKKLFRLAYDGIFNFSDVPLKLITKLGIFTVSLSLAYLAFSIYKRFVLGAVPEGFTGLMATIVLFSGVQLLSLGIIGEYVSRIYDQVKGRPLFLVKEKIQDGQSDKN